MDRRLSLLPLPSRGLRLLLGLLAAVAPVLLHAETAATPADLKPESRIFRYLYSPQQSETMFRIGQYWDRNLNLQQDCKTDFQVKPIAVVIVAPIEFDAGEPDPHSGAWKHRFRFERCGESRIYNALFVARAGDKPDARPYFPGESIVSVRLMRDALPAGLSVAGKHLPADGAPCKQIVLADTEVTQPPHGEEQAGRLISGVWQERWHFTGCGGSTRVLMHFVPDGNGSTDFRATGE
jgi:hypothetical protein